MRGHRPDRRGRGVSDRLHLPADGRERARARAASATLARCARSSPISTRPAATPGLPVGILPIEVSLVVQPEEARGPRPTRSRVRIYEWKLSALRQLARPYVAWKARPPPGSRGRVKIREWLKSRNRASLDRRGPRRRKRLGEADGARRPLGILVALPLGRARRLARSGGGSFCGFGGRFDCTALWNGALRLGVHRLTGLPISGWGLVWSAAAFVLPLAGLARLASGEPLGALVSAVRLTAGAGILAVVVLLAASAAAGALCVGCIGTYLLVGAYAAIACSAGGGRGSRGRPGLGGRARLHGGGVRAPPLPGPAHAEDERRGGTPGGRARPPLRAPDGRVRARAGRRRPRPTGTGDPLKDRKLAELVTPSIRPGGRCSPTRWRFTERSPRDAPRAPRPRGLDRGAGAHHGVHRHSLRALRGPAGDDADAARAHGPRQLQRGRAAVPSRRAVQSRLRGRERRRRALRRGLRAASAWSPRAGSPSSPGALFENRRV